jgi:hypothetical protein
MKTFYISIVFSFLFLFQQSHACNMCGGGTGELIILALDGKALFNAGFFYDRYNGVWDEFGVWRDSKFSSSQYRISFSGAYRFNKHLQFAVTLPYIMNFSSVPGSPISASSLGDVSLSGRYEFFHEYQTLNKKIDRSLPYLAITFGLTLPTGKSDETAETDVDVTGKGFFVSSLGVSLTKTLIKNHLQVSTDISWQHSFSKTYNEYFGQTLTQPFVKKQGDKLSYAVSVNYIFNNWHAVSFSVSGFNQGVYQMDEVPTINSAEHGLNFNLSYTYYPSVPFRITPSVKWNIPSNDLGRNTVGSTTFGLNLTYYFAEE